MQRLLLTATLLALGLIAACFTNILKRPWAVDIDVGGPLDRPVLRDFHEPEWNGQVMFRWSQPASALVFSGTGNMTSVDIRIHGDPDSSPLLLTSGNTTLTVPVRPGWRQLVLLPPAESRTGDIRIELTSAVRHSTTDARERGVVVDRIFIQGQTQAPAAQVLYMTLCSLLIAIVAGWMTRRRLVAVGAGLIFVGLSATALMWRGGAYRLTITGYAPRLALALALALLFGALTERSLVWLADHSHLEVSRPVRKALATVIFLAFFIRFAGMAYPLTYISDLRFHLSRTWMIRQGKLLTLFLPNPGLTPSQWNSSITIPYSPLYYVLTIPVTLLPGSGPELAMMAFSSAVDALSSLLVGLLLIQGGWSARAGYLATLIAATIPFGLLVSVSWGLYPTLLGQCLSLLTIVMWQGLGPHLLRGRAQTLMVFTMAIALISYPTALLFLGTTWTILCVLLLWQRHPLANITMRIGLLALLVALIVYYGWHIPALVRNTLPHIFARRSGSAFQLDFSQLLAALWEPLWGGFGPVLMVSAAGGLALLATTGDRAGPGSITDYSRSSLTKSILLAWGLAYIPFAIANQYLLLIEKHTLHMLPLIALLSGLSLAYSSNRIYGRYIVSLIIAFLLWQALSSEYRYIHY